MLSHFMKTAQLPPHCLIYYFPDFYHLFKVPYSINKQIYDFSCCLHTQNNSIPDQLFWMHILNTHLNIPSSI